jgi:FRG domain-containing protein
MAPEIQGDEHGFATQKVSEWDSFIGHPIFRNERWIFRGQTKDHPLSTKFERTMVNWEIDLGDRFGVERQMIRDFRRRLSGPTYSEILTDTLYCLALMQHHGAPTRLLDCTYSPFVAASFALQEGRGNRNSGSRSKYPVKLPVIWCFNGQWLDNTVMKTVGKKYFKRHRDSSRNDTTFLPMFQMDCDYQSPKKFVYHQNPLRLNERLSIQQGVFLCQGAINATFIENLKAMKGWDNPDNIIKLALDLNRGQTEQFAEMLKRMNLSSAALFPGLDGFARSIGEQPLHYKKLARQRARHS